MSKFTLKGLPNYQHASWVDTREMIETYQEELDTAKFLLVVKRYEEAPRPYSLTIVRDEDKMGWDKTARVGLLTVPVAATFTNIARFNGFKPYPWHRVPADLGEWITNYHLPIEWHGTMNHPSRGNRVTVYSRTEPEMPFIAYPDELALARAARR